MAIDSDRSPGASVGQRFTRGPSKRSFFLISNGSRVQTTGRLFESLTAGLIGHGDRAALQLRELPRGVAPKIRRLLALEYRNLPAIWRSDALVIHTPLALSIISVVLARLMRKSVVAFVWDLHPESTRLIGTMKNPVLLHLYWAVERLCYALATQLVVASEDYRDTLDRRWRRKVVVMDLWPCDPVVNAGKHAGRQDPSTLRIAFAGQLNSVRGIVPGVNQLLRAWRGERVELHVFSANELPDELRALMSAETRLDVVEHGFITPAELQTELGGLDIGWVCLDPDFELPAFPSKVLAYLAAGVPIAYSGPEMPALEGWLSGNGLGISLRAEETIGPEDIERLLQQFDDRRSAYLSRMADEWFRLDRFL